MTTLGLQRLSRRALARLISDAPHEPCALTNDHRHSLGDRFRTVVSTQHRRLDAWSVERAGLPLDSFRWSPITARRTLGNAALRRAFADSRLSLMDAVELELSDQLLRAVEGYAHSNSMSYWLVNSSPSELALIRSEATNWSTQLAELARWLDHPFYVATSDAYYDVASARTTLRARRDLVVPTPPSRVLVRLRAGSPGRSAGPGLRADLVIDALADPAGVVASRIIGLWPEAGVALSVDATMDDLRAGARDLVRAAVAQQRQRLSLAA
ncbi:MAG: hypothetical protein ACYCPT_05200 [Acidimicrobiales bacterium]